MTWTRSDQNGICLTTFNLGDLLAAFTSFSADTLRTGMTATARLEATVNRDMDVPCCELAAIMMPGGGRPCAQRPVVVQRWALDGDRYWMR